MAAEQTDEDGEHSSTNRRRLLAWLGAAGSTGLAGCLSTDSVHKLGDGGIQAEDNDRNEVFVEAPVGTMTEDVKWWNPGVPYRMVPSQVDTLHDIGGQIETEPGIEFRFEQDVGIVVHAGGSLQVVGAGKEVGEPMNVFPGVQETPGYWKGIKFSETTAEVKQITGAGIYHTGSSDWGGLSRQDEQRAAVAVTGGGEATVKACRIATFDGNAFAVSPTENPLRDDSVNATLNRSRNVIE
jgi:hypothetical protein